ncbi:MAG: lysophospholipid acyltransferase family protein [Paludibacteraceae bacterium]|nr:lysophospholipid acyltransferase family protein [Paludibacteraceae bacterium]
MAHHFTKKMLSLVARLPLTTLYKMADGLAFIAQNVVRYRRKVVNDNLIKSFPHKKEHEIQHLEHLFYRHLAYSAVEGLWMLKADEKEMRDHVEFRNMHLLTEALDEGRNVTALFGHVAGWEWICTTPLFLRPNDVVTTLYKPLKNKVFDEICLDYRSRFGVRCVPKQQVLRTLVEYKKQQQPIVMAFIADQSPSRSAKNHFVSFLNRPTAFLTGWEELSRRQDHRIVYVDIQRPADGQYVYNVELLCDHPKEHTSAEIIEKFAHCLEETIVHRPELWLWSHRRWKINPPTSEQTNNSSK